MNKQQFLITGGRGFIGVNLCNVLKDTKKVTVFDSLKRSSPTGWNESDNDLMVKGDILDEKSLLDSFESHDVIVHLAAYGSVIESIENPISNFEVNVRGTLNVLNAAKEAKIKRLIFASTGGALIGNANPPVDENSLPKPISPYGVTKLCGESYCYSFYKTYGLTTVSLRFGNVYGPHSVHKKGAVTLFMKALIKDEPIIIYGDGKASRDYIYVDDLCSGIKLAAEAPIEHAEVFHLATGVETSIHDLAKMLCDIAGKPNHPILFKPARRGEVSRNFANYEKVKMKLGFEPRIKIEDGMKKTWDWFNTLSESQLNTETFDS
jgi:UDP-glucose 4-epimerase